MMLQWTDTIAETQGDMAREQEMTHITEDDRKWATWWLQQKCTRHEASGYIATTLCFFFSFHTIHRIKNALKKGGGLNEHSGVNNTNHIQFLDGK